ncbi:MAG: hypothetical protein H6791_01150 [Candidatus Nomurabacteria bacterium]|nr:MAG: hypothetical protein H6791_01150 [Candidatus Nomurabacteria bacterium]
MIKSKIITLLLIIGDLLLIILNYHLIGKLGAFTIDNTINTLDFISLLVTISIACFVPFLIKKAIDDNRGIKSLLIEEVKDLICLIEKNHKIISELFSQGTAVENKHRDAVIYNFFDAELKLDSIRSQLEISYSSKKGFSQKIFDHSIKYKQFLTDSKFMISSYTQVDFDFYREETNAFAGFQKALMSQIHEIHKF